MTMLRTASHPPQDSSSARSAAGRLGQVGFGDERTLTELVHAAAGGDDRAWETLHARFTPMLRRVAGAYRLSSSDIDDVVQMTWVRLVNHIGRLRDPAAVAGWLATTARRECLRLLRQPMSDRVMNEPQAGDRADPLADPEGDLLAAERRVVLARALQTLPDRHRQLMMLLLAQPTMDYETVSTTLRMPRGSIGPIRARSIARLQCHSELRSVGAAC